MRQHPELSGRCGQLRSGLGANKLGALDLVGWIGSGTVSNPSNPITSLVRIVNTVLLVYPNDNI